MRSVGLIPYGYKKNGCNNCANMLKMLSPVRLDKFSITNLQDAEEYREADTVKGLNYLMTHSWGNVVHGANLLLWRETGDSQCAYTSHGVQYHILRTTRRIAGAKACSQHSIQILRTSNQAKKTR